MAPASPASALLAIDYNTHAPDPSHFHHGLLGSRPCSIDMKPRNLPVEVRASVHYYNTEDEIERFVAEVAELS